MQRWSGSSMIYFEIHRENEAAKNRKSACRVISPDQHEGVPVLEINLEFAQTSIASLRWCALCWSEGVIP